MVPDYYTILGVSRTALPEEIRRAFHDKAKEYHPDVFHGKDGDRIFKLFNEAYRTLINPEKRRRYDLKLRYGSLSEFKYQADNTRQRRSQSYDEIYKRRKEQSRRETETMRKKFRVFDGFIFWSLLCIGLAGIVFGIIDAIINFRFYGLLICIVIVTIILFASASLRKTGKL